MSIRVDNVSPIPGSIVVDAPGELVTLLGTDAVLALRGSSGALSGQAGTLVGQAGRLLLHGTSGALSGQAGALEGLMARLTLRGTSGALSGQVGTLAGLMAQLVMRGTSGAIETGAAQLLGTAGILVLRGTAGALSGQPVTLVGVGGRLMLRGSSGALIPVGGLGDICQTSLYVGPTKLLEFFTGRANSYCLHLYANGVEIDYDKVIRVEAQVAGGSFDLPRAEDHFVLALGSSGIEPGTYAVRIVVYSVDYPLGVVWGHRLVARIN